MIIYCGGVGGTFRLHVLFEGGYYGFESDVVVLARTNTLSVKTNAHFLLRPLAAK